MSSSEKGPTVHTKHLSMFLGRKSIIHRDGKEWRFHRKNMTKTFNSDTIENIDGPVKDKTTEFVSALSEKIHSSKDGIHCMNGEDFAAALVSRVVGTVFFGFDLEGSVLERDELSKTYNTLLEEFDRRVKSPFNPAARFYSIPTFSNIKYKRDHRRARQMFVETLKKHNRKGRNEGEVVPKAWKGRSDFLMAILDFVQEQGYSSDDEEVIDMMVTAYLLSLESMMTAVQYMLYCAAQNPEVECKCLEEIRSILQKSNEYNVDELPYCNAFIMEVLRLYPILTFSWRKLESPLEVGETTLPAGLKVYVPYYHLHRDKRNFPLPEKVIPERWVERSDSGGYDLRFSGGWDRNSLNKTGEPVPPIVLEDIEDTPSTEKDGSIDPSEIPAGDRKKLFSFGKGGRNCPGMKIARKEACIFFVELIRHFKFELEPGYVAQPRVKGVGQKPAGGIPFIISNRG